MSSKPRQQGAQRNEFLSIAATLQERIKSGAIGLGRMLPTERELQLEFAVSRSTIRRALRKLTDEGWVKNLANRGAVASAGFAPTSAVNIALIDGGTYVLRVLMHRFSQKLRDYGYHMVHLAGSSVIAMEDPLQYAVDNDFAGVIVWPYRGFTDEFLVEQLTSLMPVVALDHKLPGGRADLVSFDYAGAAELATTQLIKHGCRRVGIAGMYDMLETNHQRFTGYMKALFAAGLQPEPRNFMFTMTSALPLPDTQQLERRLADPDRPDGLFVFQDEFVPTVVESVLRSGLRVPEDVKIVTIGDEVDVSVDDVSLTSVALDWDTMAARAIELLLDRIGNPTREVKLELVPHQLIVRGFAGEPREEWTTHPETLTGFHGDYPYPRSQYQFTSSWSVRNRTTDPHLQ